MLLLITGDGKGKTTSAIGNTIRALGYGNKVVFAEFMKGWKENGENQFFDQVREIDSRHAWNLHFKRFGNGDWVFKKYNDPHLKPEEKKKNEAHRQLVLDGLQWVQETSAKENPFLIVLDEIIVAEFFHLISESELFDFIDNLPPESHIILTGRRASEKLKEKADLVSVIEQEKHYYNEGKMAIEGIDY